MGLCFGFALKRGLIYVEMFSLLLSYAHTVQITFLLLPLPYQQVGWGHTRSCEGTQLGLLTPNDPEDIPYHMLSCLVYKAGARRNGEHLDWWHLSSPGNEYIWWSPAFQEMADPWKQESGEAFGSWEVGNEFLFFASLVCTAFALPIKLFLSQPSNFLPFILQIFSPIPVVGK